MKFALATFFLLVLVPASARAEPTVERPRPYFSARFNPLSLLIGRASGEAEVWVTEHVSIVGTVFRAKLYEAGGEHDAHPGDFNNYTVRGPSSELSLAGFEAGVRYSHLKRLRTSDQVGAFVGGNVGPAWGRWDFPTSGDGAASARITQVTGAVEGGGILIIGPIIAEVGLGLQATHNFGRDPTGDCGDAIVCVSTTHWFYGSGFTPRILTSVGLVF